MLPDIKNVWFLGFYIQILVPLVHCTDDVPEPVGFFPLNSLHTTKDISNSYLTAGTAVGVSVAPGPYGKPNGSYYFPGSSSSYIEIPQQTQLDTRYSLTVLLWVFSEGLVGPIFLYEPGVVNKWAPHMFVIGESEIIFRSTTRTSHQNLASLSFGGGTKYMWRYIGYSYDHSTGYQRLFVDGIQVAEGSIGQVELSTNYKIVLGGSKVGDDKAFKGRLSCLQIFNKALTQSQLQAAKENCIGENACLEPKIINEPTRALDFTVRIQIPERTVFVRGLWYRFQSTAGTRIPTSCPVPGSCGAQSPGWLNGQYPSMETGILKMEICYRSGVHCCANKTIVYVRQCYGYPVFMFEDVPDVSLGNRVCTETDPTVYPTVSFQSGHKGCLVDHVMKTLSRVTDDSTCMTYCLHTSENCQSVNFIKSLNGTCQFNNATLTDYPLHVTVDSSCRYYQRTAVMSYIIP